MAFEHSHLQRCMEKDCAHPSAAHPPAAEPLPLGADDEGPVAAPVSISLEAEVPEVLFDGMRQFLEHHPQWDQYRLISSALAGFLFQNGCGDQGVTQHYLNGLFLRP
jgi:hypothetical protein